MDVLACVAGATVTPSYLHVPPMKLEGWWPRSRGWGWWMIVVQCGSWCFILKDDSWWIFRGSIVIAEHAGRIKNDWWYCEYGFYDDHLDVQDWLSMVNSKKNNCRWSSMGLAWLSWEHKKIKRWEKQHWWAYCLTAMDLEHVAWICLGGSQGRCKLYL